MVSKRGDQKISVLKLRSREGRPLVSQEASLFYKSLLKKKGLGSYEAPASPTTVQEAAERATKLAKLADDSIKQGFRARSRVECEEKRDERGFSSAGTTCSVLDEKAGVK